MRRLPAELSNRPVTGVGMGESTAQSVAGEDAGEVLGQLHYRRWLREGIAAEVDGAALQRLTQRECGTRQAEGVGGSVVDGQRSRC